ncbi:Lrp/AsnC family transcriptional regulator [Streptomyces sp. TR1341]|uniref:DNA-binding Lrp family transcriptional regulator n=2 Tax=Streptomyces TaxID=1883 RepID=A0A7W3RJH1_STRMR|nr:MULTISPECIES: Lrp/AsnC family transcriptional regulator [Streptomyces]MBA9052032.1 DNA-binding Lrp family transcriptional regulator [Streptomyces murinus]NDK23534.1 Lrp/AsnC family transcriptional regulator [Streptomyces sp. TR1341]UWW93313.1 AsnC family transcriptional regulator [Streptomyces murinus]WSI83975.1 Lrp/AsnC family transcriptional regulator [Streptomyces murinus]
MESDYDELDRRLIHALQIDGRAPFSAIAAALGVSDRTVARRYARLRSAGVIRVLGGFDPTALGAVLWFLRVRCAPAASLPVAEALAARPDTSWVSLNSGGTEITCVVRTESEADSEALLLAKLPRTPRVEGVTAHSVLHAFYGGPDNLVGKLGWLDAAAIERLRPPPLPHRPGPVRLDDGDRKLLALLATDGRAGFEQLAAATGWSPTTVRRRMTELREHGVLYLDLDVDWRVFGGNARTLLWLSVAPAHLEEAGRALAGHPEIAFAAATTGPTNLYASVVCANQRELYRYLTTRIAALPAITHLETAPVIRTVKQAANRI